MISSEMIKFLESASDVLELARKDREEGNLFGAGQLARHYEELVEAELNYWHVSYDYAVRLGLVEKTNF